MKLGDRVYMKSGSPRLLVVDVFAEIDGMKYTVAWVDKAGARKEYTAPARCFTRVRPRSSAWQQKPS